MKSHSDAEMVLAGKQFALAIGAVIAATTFSSLAVWMGASRRLPLDSGATGLADFVEVALSVTLWTQLAAGLVLAAVLTFAPSHWRVALVSWVSALGLMFLTCLAALAGWR